MHGLERRPRLWLTLAVLVLVATGWYLRKRSIVGRVHGDPNRIYMGMTEAEVEGVIGTPGRLCYGHRSSSCGYALEWTGSGWDVVTVRFDAGGSACGSMKRGGGSTFGYEFWDNVWEFIVY